MDGRTGLSLRILVVEDSLDIQVLMARILSGHGYAVECVSNGLEALDRLRSGTSLPQLILLDLMMPVMDGYEFKLAQEREPKFSDIPVIVMSADGDILSKAKKIGAQAFIKKPFLDLELVLGTISQVLGPSH